MTRVVHALDDASIEYMVTRFVASSLQGEPRLTHDLDVLIAIEASQVPCLLEAFPRPEFYVDAEAAREAVPTSGMFNVIDTTEGDRIDFWILTDEPFDRSRFTRRYVEPVFDLELRVSSPEDTILAKLRWSKLSGGSEKQFRDALRVYEVQADRLDRKYLNEWAVKLAVHDLWARLLQDAEEY